ncbi:MAG: TerB family tellurite resistance protein [Campylobacterota bacterium]|nr:TerB family tellurite resistance protein [Campylobacterota bacterium]
MEALFLFVAIAFFYWISRSYNPNDYQNIKIDSKQTLQGSLEDHEAGLLIALMSKVAKADGQVSSLEAEILSHTFTDIASHFENQEQIREGLKEIYIKEKESFDDTIEICEKFYKLTKRDYQKRLKVMEYLLNLAFIDGDFSKTEFMITEDIANTLQIKRADFENMINKFEIFYKQQQENQALSIEKAYEVLGVSQNDDLGTVKKKYRNLVKQHHPDIIHGQGGSQSIIDEATEKLQEINEAYELIKKEKK